MDVDVAVIGLGVLGAATLRELARRGLRVVGLEQFPLGHARGSSHGRSRALRFLYHAPEYVALLRPAVDGWRELEAETGRSIYLACGTLFFARPGNQIFDQNLAVMAGGGLPYELLDEATARRRFPAFAMTDGAVGVFNPDGGLVDADAAVGAFLAGAGAAGAEVRDLTRVLAIASGSDGVALTTDDGDIVRAGHVVVASGAWTDRLVPDLALPIRVTGQSGSRCGRPIRPRSAPIASPSGATTTRCTTASPTTAPASRWRTTRPAARWTPTRPNATMTRVWSSVT